MLFFGRRKKCIECCYCAKMMRIREDDVRCECGKEENPRFYMQDHAIAKPFHVPIIGWPSVGKTVWLHSLTRRMRELSRSVWKAFTPTPGNEATMRFQRGVEEATRKGELPDTTQLGVHEAYVMVLLNMPYWGSRTFVMRDCGGENYEDFIVPDDQVPFLANYRSSFFMFSLSDLDDAKNSDKSMEQLLQGYINTLLRQGCDIREQRRKVIVILSKADVLKDDLPEHLYEYLKRDPITFAINTNGRSSDYGVQRMAEYTEIMARVSDELRDWVSSRTDGKQFINLAKAQNIDLRFSLISSLGGAPNGGDEGLHWVPYRVLDPFFWALEFHSA